MSTISRRIDGLKASGATYCGNCLREDVPTTAYRHGGRICASCEQHIGRKMEARDTAGPLVLEYLRTRRALLREHDAEIHGSVEIDLDAEPSEVFLAAQDAGERPVAFLGRTYAAQAVIGALDHHFAADYSVHEMEQEENDGQDGPDAA